MEQFILSLDQGTTSSRAIVFNHAGEIETIAQKEFAQHYPQSGWVEHDPNEIWSTQVSVAAEALARTKIPSAHIAAIGITNQRETTILWNKNTGRPVYNAIVWQDRRTAGYCDQLKKDGLESLIRSKTGLLIDAYFSATKIRWILQNVPEAARLAENGQLAFGTVDSWLIWNLTRGQLHITDVSNASRTLLFNINTLEWDHDLLDLFNIPPGLLPEVRSSSENYGTASIDIFTHSIPVAGIAGDQQAALFGQQCLNPGDIKNTYGTGAFTVLNTGNEIVNSSHKLLSTIAWKINGEVTYALEGSIFIAGAIVQWLRDGLGIIRSSAEVEQLAASVNDNNGVYFVPALTGLGAPHWDQHARGTITGLTRGCTAAHIARAALEGMAFQTYDVLNAMKADSGMEVNSLKVDGGAAANNLLLQFQSDILDIPVIRPRVQETTALGAAYLAGMAVGFWSGLNDTSSQWKEQRTFNPAIHAADRNNKLNAWHNAVNRSKSNGFEFN